MTWFAVIGLCLMGAMSPGPSLALVLKHTLHAGRRQGMVAGFAHGLGVGMHALAAMLGIAAIITTSPTLFTLIQWAGAAFLAYLGLKGLLAKHATPTAIAPAANNSCHSARYCYLMMYIYYLSDLFIIYLFL